MVSVRSGLNESFAVARTALVPDRAPSMSISPVFTLSGTIGLFDLAAIAVFAVTGALVASRKQMDIFGFALLGTVTGIGGGTIRDILLGVPVFWVREPSSLLVCIAVSAATFVTAHLLHSRYRAILWLDAVGLAAYCVIGADKALASGAGGTVAVVMGVITAAFGGIVRDILGGEVPLLLRRDVYVTAALAGALAFVGLSSAKADPAVAWVAGAAVCFVVRALALSFDWSLPVYRSRPGRSVEELAALGLWRVGRAPDRATAGPITSPLARAEKHRHPEPVASRPEMPMSKTVTYLNPETAPKPSGLYSHVAIAEAGRLAFIAGQVAVDMQGNIVAPGDCAGQVPAVFANLGRILDGLGAKFSDVVELTTYIVGPESRAPYFESRSKVYAQLFPNGSYPPNTLLIISGLVRPEMLVEISMVVRLPG